MADLLHERLIENYCHVLGSVPVSEAKSDHWLGSPPFLDEEVVEDNMLRLLRIRFISVLRTERIEVQVGRERRWLLCELFFLREWVSITGARGRRGLEFFNTFNIFCNNVLIKEKTSWTNGQCYCTHYQHFFIWNDTWKLLQLTNFCMIIKMVGRVGWTKPQVLHARQEMHNYSIHN